MSFSSLVAYFRASPQRAFAFDGVGALASALALGLLLPRVAALVGASVDALRLLGGVALGYAAYDLACLVAQPVRWRVALRVTASANAAYPAISVAVLAADGVPLGPLGQLYFAVEFAVVGSLAALQFVVAGSPRG